ncbi:MAG TPA: long-chain fatty acid--CoA ligase, partial [Porticoccaceae bacterium]|nr:long-chain fatty acid--CoA ligase [Porticoccaceae bacterium]
VVPNTDVVVQEQDVLNFLKDKIARWWMPDACVFVDTLPHTATGKISKKDLRALFKDYQWP